MLKSIFKFSITFLALSLVVLVAPQRALAAVPTATFAGITTTSAGTTHDFSVTTNSNTSYVIIRVEFSGNPVGLGAVFDPSGINEALTEASGSGVFDISGAGGSHADFIFRISGRGLSAGSHTLRFTMANSMTLTGSVAVIDNAATSGSGPEGSLDYDREGNAGNGVPAGLTLTSVKDALLISFLTTRENRSETPSASLTSNAYQDTTHGLGMVAIQRADTGTATSSDTWSTYSLSGNTGFLSGAYTFLPASNSGFVGTSGTTGQSHAFTQTPGSNRIVVVSIAWESNGNQTDTVNTITYGGNAPSGSTAMAMNADAQPVTQYVRNYFWLESALPANGSRTAVFTITNPGGGAQGYRTQVTQFNDMAQVVPSGSATASENDQSVDVTVSTANSSVIMSVIHNTAAVDATVGGSFAAGDEKWDVSTGDTRALGATKDSVSPSTFTGSWSGVVSRPATTVAVMAPFSTPTVIKSKITLFSRLKIMAGRMIIK